jgi:hypothetical protein
MSSPPGAAAAAGVLFPDLLGTPEPAPPARPRGSRILRTLARIILWSLIAVGALRGIVPTSRAAPDQLAANASDRRAEAVATAFMREYLTVGSDRAARAERLGRFTVDGLDLRRSVSIPAEAAQYTDHVVASGSRPLGGGIEVTVLAHVLQIRSGTYYDIGMLAFAVPLVVRHEGVLVTGRPRPVRLPVASGLPLGRPREVPAKVLQAAPGVARLAFAAADQTARDVDGGGFT